MDIDQSITLKLSNAIGGGGAICLLGAGFSIGAKDSDGLDIPSSSKLTKELMGISEIDSEEEPSLTDIADYCEGDPALRIKMRNLLMSRLTLAKPTDAQRRIVNQPWRSIFTTNFDDIIEVAAEKIGVQVISPTSSSVSRIAGKVPLYYLHGRAKDLVESSVATGIVVAERNYLGLKSENKLLYDQLLNEIFCSNLLVIVGYSIKDLQIAQIVLGDGQAFRDKTIVICAENESKIGIARLEKFGTVLPMGLQRFSELVDSFDFSGEKTVDQIQFLESVEFSSEVPPIQSDDFQSLLLSGTFDPGKYFGQLQAGASSADIYCIERKLSIEKIVNRNTSGVSRFIASSDYGNGKSIFLEQLAVSLKSKGYEVWKVSTGLSEVFQEIEIVLKNNGSRAFLIDDVIRYRKVAAFIGPRLNGDDLIVCCVRGEKDEAALRDLEASLGGAVATLNLNSLNSAELESWNLALERWGFWEHRISQSAEERLSFLQKECSSENRSIVLSLFKNSQIAVKIDQLVNFFLMDRRFVKEFACLLISSLCQRHVSWESMVAWLKLDQESLRREISASDIGSLFHTGRNWNIFTSAQLADHILHRKFMADEGDVLVEVYTTIVINTASGASGREFGQDFRENLKELMKYRFLTRLFGPEQTGVQIIGKVYKKLSDSPYIRKNPQFWLQFAMSRMEVGDLPNAESYLNTAMGLAVGKGEDYSPFQIRDQRARLFFRKNSLNSGLVSRNEVGTAIADLDEVLQDRKSDIIYAYRSAPLIESFVEMQISFIEAETKSKLIAILERIKSLGDGYKVFPLAKKGETESLRRSLANALLVLRFGD